VPHTEKDSGLGGREGSIRQDESSEQVGYSRGYLLVYLLLLSWQLTGECDVCAGGH
jgi:hypothetical protein